jgi:hypothetical protein
MLEPLDDAPALAVRRADQQDPVRLTYKKATSSPTFHPKVSRRSLGTVTWPLTVIVLVFMR